MHNAVSFTMLTHHGSAELGCQHVGVSFSNSESLPTRGQSVGEACPKEATCSETEYWGPQHSLDVLGGKHQDVVTTKGWQRPENLSLAETDQSL